MPGWEPFDLGGWGKPVYVKTSGTMVKKTVYRKEGGVMVLRNVKVKVGGTFV